MRKVCLFRYQLCRTRVKLLALSSHTTVDWKHQKCKCIMLYLKDSFIVSLFFFLFIHNMALLQRLVTILQALGLKTLTSKNACYSHSQKPRVLISTFASFELFDVLPCNSSPENGVSLGSVSVSYHTSDIIFAVMSHKSLCRIYVKSPFLQLILCWISSLLQQGQDVGRLLIDFFISVLSFFRLSTIKLYCKLFKLML